MSNEQPNWRENLNKEWCKDFATMTNKEITDVLGLMFYQIFLIELDSIKITSDLDSNGNYVKFEIAGEAYRDSDGMIEGEFNDI